MIVTAISRRSDFEPFIRESLGSVGDDAVRRGRNRAEPLHDSDGIDANLFWLTTKETIGTELYI